VQIGSARDFRLCRKAAECERVGNVKPPASFEESLMNHVGNRSTSLSEKIAIRLTEMSAGTSWSDIVRRVKRIPHLLARNPFMSVGESTAAPLPADHTSEGFEVPPAQNQPWVRRSHSDSQKRRFRR